MNLASRLEGVNKEYGTRILVSERTRAEAERDDPDLVFRPLDKIAVKGKSVAVEIYEVVGRREALTEEKRKLLEWYGKGIELYRSRSFREAQSCFEEALLVDPGDGPTIVYVARCKQFLIERPVESWDAVFRMETK